MKAYLKSPVLEVLLGQIILYILIWLWDNYIATYLTLVLTGIFIAILIISLISEWLSETTPVPRRYFHFLVISIIAPILSAVVALFVIGIPWGV
jgi:prepilin signal peptidase PulO-like enzyme (type II secretory pathway)